MKLSAPIAQPLPKECEKAAKIFRSFVDNGNNGLDGVIPRSVLENAKGFAIFTIFKAGFVFSARAGSGVVIAKLDDGSWSAPSAIGTAGLGVGGQMGAEMTDFLVVLNTRSAIATFMSAGSLSLGGNMSIALGPLGRNGEALGSVNTKGKLAAMYSYSKTRGLFGGVSIEGSVIVERQDANALAYNSPVTARMLLGGSVDPPPWASALTDTLQKCTGLPGNRTWVSDTFGAAENQYAFGGLASPGAELRKKKKDQKSPFPPASWGTPTDSGSYFEYPAAEPAPSASSSRHQWEWTPDLDVNSRPAPTRAFTDLPRDTAKHRFSQSLSNAPSLPRSNSLFDSISDKTHRQSRSLAQTSSASNPFSQEPAITSGLLLDGDSHPIHRNERRTSYIKPKPELARPLLPHEGIARAVALFDFQAVEPGDLSFSKGDVITIVQKSASSDDWWSGKVGDRKGLFPANFVDVV